MSYPGLVSSKWDIKITNLKNWLSLVKQSHGISWFLRYPLPDKKNLITIPGISGITESWTPWLLKRTFSDFNPFVSNATFLYPLKTSENLTVFWCFQGVEKGCIGNSWVNQQKINKYQIKLQEVHEKLEFWFLPEKCHKCLEVFRLMLF